MSLATTPITTSPEPLISLKRAAALGYGGYSTLRRDIKAGLLPAVKIGNRLMVRSSDLEVRAVPERPAPFEDAVKHIVATAPPLTDEQVQRLFALLGGAA
ncbi:DNA-binding protein [Corynebacterium alimapuense]|uniref:DNA-binding protein n=2 Tax=Corynebacterium alimapuense TaxID=1576874 RepID=A0A3M8K6R6_9CORY|nr:DNA-binding protein [Corynebacterium alimapuense]